MNRYAVMNASIKEREAITRAENLSLAKREIKAQKVKRTEEGDFLSYILIELLNRIEVDMHRKGEKPQL